MRENDPVSTEAPALRRDLRAPALVGATGLAAFAALRLRDPHQDGSWGYCPFLWVTGRPCPFCGGLRAVNDLTHGDVVGAMSSNLLAVLLVAALGVAWVLWVWRRWRGRVDRMIVLSPRASAWVLAGIGVFWVARLTPWGSWLAP